MSKIIQEEEVREIVALILGIPEVEPEHRLVEDLRAESVDVVNLVAALEDRYQLSIPEQDLGELRTVEDLADLVMKQARG